MLSITLLLGRGRGGRYKYQLLEKSGPSSLIGLVCLHPMQARSQGRGGGGQVRRVFVSHPTLDQADNLYIVITERLVHTC